MKFEKEEIKRLAEVINVSITDDETNELVESLTQLTEKLDELINVEVSEKPKFSGSGLNNVFASDKDSEEDLKFMESLNNFDGEYVNVEQVINDEQ